MQRAINRHVGLLFRMGERYLNDALAGSGVTSGTAPLLLELRDGGERHLSALATAVGVDRAHITRAVRALELAGFVSVSPAAAGGRTRTASLTQQGLAAAARVEATMRAWVDLVSRDVLESDLDRVEAVFDRFYANAVAHFGGGPRT